MKKLMLSILFIFFLASFCMAQTCDCKIVPYTPASCFSSCTSSIIIDSTLEELLIVVGLKKEIAEKILDYNEKNKAKKIQSIEEYREVLKEEFDEFEAKLQSLNTEQINYLKLPIKERKDERLKLVKINKAINELRNTITITARAQ